MKPTKDPEFLIIDLFCGAGGTTTGFATAERMGNKLANVIACINHDAKAIESHWLNHPEVEHYEEDITKMYGSVKTFKIWGYNAKSIHDYKPYNVFFKSDELIRLERLVNIYRAFYPNAKVILWASLECTNFSKAKGGQPRDADSRTLADHLDRYIAALNPDYVQIENVVEFMSWGPLDENGKPVSRKAGSDWLRWCKHIDSFGYRNEWKELNSADFGAYTSRNRLFGCFAKDGLPIFWPQPTHAKKPVINGFFNNVKKWKPVKEVLDFTDEGESIFNRKKPLVDPSLERIYAGLIKFVAGGKDAFILKYNSTDQKGKSRQASIDEPCPTIATQNRLGMCFIAKYYSGKPSGKVIPVTGPAGTIKTSDGQSLIQCKPFIVQRNSGNPDGRVISVDNPARTLTATGGNQELVQAKPFILNTNFNNVGRSVEEPACTLVASRRHPYLVNPCYLTQYYSSGGQLASIDEPARTLGTRDTIAKIQPIWFDKTFTGNGNIQSINNPAGAILPNDKHRLINCSPIILNPSHGGHCTSTEKPGPVIIARQDKAPLYLLQFKIDPSVSIPVYDDDSPIMVKIKEFMVLYGISDIKMRMLKVLELLKIQGFPVGYILSGNQSDQKKFIGNSVVPHVVKAWCEAMADGLYEYRMAA